MFGPRIAQRNLETRSSREVVSRLVFALYIVSLPAALILCALGASRHAAGLLVAAGIVAATFVLIHLFARGPLGFASILSELKRNPFKPARSAAPESTTPQSGQPPKDGQA